jgi:hypothetical protein
LVAIAEPVALAEAVVVDVGKGVLVGSAGVAIAVAMALGETVGSGVVAEAVGSGVVAEAVGSGVVAEAVGSGVVGATVASGVVNPVGVSRGVASAVGVPVAGVAWVPAPPVGVSSGVAVLDPGVNPPVGAGGLPSGVRVALGVPPVGVRGGVAVTLAVRACVASAVWVAVASATRQRDETGACCGAAPNSARPAPRAVRPTGSRCAARGR